MAGTKKPRKKYKPGKVLAGGNLPIAGDLVSKMEIKILAAIDCLKSNHFDGVVAVDVILFLTICREVMQDEDTEALSILLTAFKALNRIKERQRRTGKWGASGDEIRGLSESLVIMLDLFKQLNRDDLSRGNARAGRALAKAFAFVNA